MADRFSRLLRSTLLPSSSRLMSSKHQRRDLFSLQSQRNYASDMRKTAHKEHILRLLRNEIRCQQHRSPPKIPPSKYYAYSIDDRPGEQWVCLRTKFVDEEEVKIEATMVVDKEVPIPESSDGGPKDEVDPHITCVVNISKGGGDVLEIMCSAWPNSIEVSKLFVRRDGSLSANIYDGPEVKELDKRLEDALYDFLEARGIDDELAEFLHEYMKNKHKAEYIRWMCDVKSHIEEK